MPEAPFASQVFSVIGSSGSGKSLLCDRLHHLLGSAQRLRCSPPLPDFLAIIPVLKLEWKNSRLEFLRHIRYVLRAEIATANASDRLLREIESDINGANTVKSWFIQFNIGVILIDGCNNASLTPGTPEVLDTIAEVSKWTGIPVVIFGTPLFMHRLANGSMPGPYLTSGPKLDLDDFSPPLKSGELDINGSWYSTVSEIWRMSAMSQTEMHKSFPLWAYEHSPVLQHMVYGVWDFMRHSIAFTQSGETFEFGEESEKTAQNAEPHRELLRHPESLEASNLKAERVKKMMGHTSKLSKRLRQIAYQVGTTGHVQSEDDFRRYPDYMPSAIVCNPAYESWVGTGLTSGIRPSPRSVGIIRSPKPKTSASG
nr:ATP-binding protein [Herbaspirillum sp. 1130]